MDERRVGEWIGTAIVVAIILFMVWAFLRGMF
jgi:hypothetical protein